MSGARERYRITYGSFQEFLGLHKEKETPILLRREQILNKIKEKVRKHPNRPDRSIDDAEWDQILQVS